MNDVIGGLEFHHVGVACRDLERETRALRVIGYALEGDDFEDPQQGIRGRFLVGQGPRLELVSPLSVSGGILENILAKGHKMYHLAYTTTDLRDALARSADQGAKIVVPPVPAVAFGGREIAFLFLKNMMLMELIEGAIPSGR